MSAVRDRDGRCGSGPLAPDQHDHGGPAMTGAGPGCAGSPPGAHPRQSLSVVIPVYRAGAALESTVREVLEVCGDVSPTPGVRIALDELILVCDNPGLPVEALDHLASLADLDERVRVVWLSRNFGQHPATVAGIVSTNGDWVVTMDEDGQHDPGVHPGDAGHGRSQPHPAGVRRADQHPPARRDAQRRVLAVGAGGALGVGGPGAVQQLPAPGGEPGALGVRLRRGERVPRRVAVVDVRAAVGVPRRAARRRPRRRRTTTAGCSATSGG